MSSRPNDAGCCPFCRLIAAAPAERAVVRHDDVVVLTDIAPINRGHVLVVPALHVPDLAKLDPAVGGRMFAVAQRCAAALRASDLPCDGVNLFLNDGAAASQTVEHVHLHVVPRFEGDGWRMPEVERRQADAASLGEVAAKLRALLGRHGG